MKWTKAYRKAAGKELAWDSTFEFEKIRNRPVRYDRNLVVKTLEAMTALERIRDLRKKRFFLSRMAKAREVLKPRIRRELEKHETLVKGPVVPKKRIAEAEADVSTAMTLDSMSVPTLVKHEEERMASREKITAAAKTKKAIRNTGTARSFVDEDIQM